MTREEFDLLPGEEKFSRLMFLVNLYLGWFSDYDQKTIDKIPMLDLTKHWGEFESNYQDYKEYKE